MNLKFNIFIILFVIISINNLKGQDTIQQQNVLYPGISLQAGLGFLAVCDESISKEKYSGWYPHVGLGFERYHKNHFRQRILKLYQGSGIRNYNVSAKLAQIHFSEKKYYHVHNITLFSNDGSIHIGPLTDYYLYF